MIKSGKYIFVFALYFMMPVLVYPQQSRSAAATKKNEHVKEETKKAYEKARKKTIKHRREIQTKETQKRMDEADKRAEAYNRRNNKKWYEDIFKRKKPRR